ncbi:MAG: hypothetical protein GWN55_07800 [Phycisphaerae bacterium]|nr:hypothetical protein [Phycisphaerae bacterium]NIU25984.1 hypothetical protein [candidate division KSB1 bacterium]NIS54779.1 hypothetical protein [Phycisphaerae bacterium]NIV01210.1 hypothetical protein [Phycisphaerae bacterium]NIV71109.1 hypothetical protein [Phycisphaerae bacterium]
MIYRGIQLVILSCITAGLLLGGVDNTAFAAGVVVRAENFIVPPSTGPLTHILVRNPDDKPCTVTIQPKFPDGWQWTPRHRTLTMEPNQVQRLPFNIEKASDVESNRYPVEIAIVEGVQETVHRQDLVCASAPYFKPKIDGKFKDWSDSIPVTFTTDGKKTVISTYWNKQYFCLYVQVEEDKLRGYKKKSGLIDAVQFALAPRNAVTASLPTAGAQRYEFLVVNFEGLFAKDKCFFLIKPDVKLSVTQERRPLETLGLKEAQVVVKRKGGTTHYECAIPFAVMPGIKPDVGREIQFSVLVHDPDGTGVRDWGKAAGLWPERRNKYAWCAGDWWELSGDGPYDSKVEWGLCSSKH